MKKELLIGGVAAALLFTQGSTFAAAKGKEKKKVSHKITVLDINKDGIPDKWELANKLGLGKDVAKKDNDKDGLNNLIEYKLHLNPNSADTNHNGITDGNEDSDKDGLSNSAEVEMNLDPSNPDSNHDHVKDGMEVSQKDGVKLSDEIRSFQLSMKTVQGSEIQVEFKKHDGRNSFSIQDKTGIITNDMALELMKNFYGTSGLTKEAIISKVTALFPADTIAAMEVEVKYVNGKEVDAKGEEKSHENKNHDKHEGSGNEKHKSDNQNENKDEHKQKQNDDNEHEDHQNSDSSNDSEGSSD